MSDDPVSGARRRVRRLRGRLDARLQGAVVEAARALKVGEVSAAVATAGQPGRDPASLPRGGRARRGRGRGADRGGHRAVARPRHVAAHRLHEGRRVRGRREAWSSRCARASTRSARRGGQDPRRECRSPCRSAGRRCRGLREGRRGGLRDEDRTRSPIRSRRPRAGASRPRLRVRPLLRPAHRHHVRDEPGRRSKPRKRKSRGGPQARAGRARAPQARADGVERTGAARSPRRPRLEGHRRLRRRPVERRPAGPAARPPNSRRRVWRSQPGETSGLVETPLRGSHHPPGRLTGFGGGPPRTGDGGRPAGPGRGARAGTGRTANAASAGDDGYTLAGRGRGVSGPCRPPTSGALRLGHPVEPSPHRPPRRRPRARYEGGRDGLSVEGALSRRTRSSCGSSRSSRTTWRRRRRRRRAIADARAAPATHARRRRRRAGPSRPAPTLDAVDGSQRARGRRPRARCGTTRRARASCCARIAVKARDGERRRDRGDDEPDADEAERVAR